MYNRKERLTPESARAANVQAVKNMIQEVIGHKLALKEKHDKATTKEAKDRIFWTICNKDLLQGKYERLLQTIEIELESCISEKPVFDISNLKPC